MNFVSPGIEKRMPKATLLHKQLQEAEAVLSRGFSGFDPLSPTLAGHQRCLCVTLPIEMRQFPVQMFHMQITCRAR